MLDVTSRTENDRYNVFPEHPDVSSQTVVSGPGAGNTESPRGWLFSGPQKSVDIAGNNVHAYLDTDANDVPDPGGSSVLGGEFLSAADLSMPPATPTNQDVAVQNLFYLINLAHDTLYRHGFTETAFNFQENNFRKGGAGSDSVKAEAQDGLLALFNNGMFATPFGDGRNPRMQISLFHFENLLVHSPSGIARNYLVQRAAFGPQVDPTGVTGDVVLVDDGVGASADACEPIANSVAGKIALMDRGTCTFIVKVRNAQDAGAIAAVITNQEDFVALMQGTDPSITIPAVMIGQTDGQTLRSVTGVSATVKSKDPRERDGSLDSDLVWHEYTA